MLFFVALKRGNPNVPTSDGRHTDTLTHKNSVIVLFFVTRSIRTAKASGTRKALRSLILLMCDNIPLCAMTTDCEMCLTRKMTVNIVMKFIVFS